MKRSMNLKKLGWRSLGVKIGAQMLGLALIPLIILSIILVITLSNSVRNLEQSVTSARQEMAQGVIGANLQGEAYVIQEAIDTYMRERMQNVIEWANVPVIRQAAEEAALKAQELGLTEMSVDQIEARMDGPRALLDDAQVTAYLNDLVARTPAFIEIFFTDAHGYNVAYSNRTSDFVQAGEEWWDTAWNAGIAVGDVEYDDSAGVYSIDISIRIENTEGKRVGVMKALLDINALQDLATESVSRVSGGTVRLFTKDGDQIADTSSDHDPTMIMTDEGNLLRRDWMSAKEVLLKEDLENGYILDQHSLDGQPIAVGYAFSEQGANYGIQGFSGFDWAVMVTQSEDVAFASLQSLDTSIGQMQAMRNTILVVLLVIGSASAIVAVTIAVFVAVSIANPIQMLTEAAVRLSEGDAELADMDWDKIAKVNVRKDELGSIGKAFSALIDYFKTGAAAMQRIAAGDVAVEIQPKSDADAMGNAFVRMIAYQQEMAATADLLAEGDLTAEVIPQSAQDRLGNAFQRMIANLRDLIGQVQENAAQVTAASLQISSASEQSAQATQQVATTVQQIAQGTAQQTEGVTQTVSTVDQMSRSIDSVARGAQEQAAAVARSSEVTAQISTAIQQVTANAQAGAQGSTHAAQTARAGAQVVQETVAGMEAIREKVSISAEKVLEMGQRSEQIGEIVDTIEYIASQTNLFALNAAIEAARAGEHGKGFEVVAEEVRKLAESAAESTKEIATLIKGMQGTIAEAVRAMEEGAAEVDTGVQRANQSGQALEAILEAVETVNIQVGEIATASEQIGSSANEMVDAMDAVSAVVEENTASTEEMAAGAGEVSTSIENIASISEENSASTEEVSASVEEVSAQAEEVTASAQMLSEMAQDLQTVVAQFRLPA